MFVKSTLAAVAVLASLAGTAAAPAQAEAAKPAPVVVGQPLAQAHAHNDYEHERPLFDALEHGFTSVEADVWLVDGELLVAHDLEDVQPGAARDAIWTELAGAGVDHINTDDLAALQQFLTARAA